MPGLRALRQRMCGLRRATRSGTKVQDSAQRACAAGAPHGARVLVIDQHQLHGGVALVRLQVCAGGRNLPHQVARKAVLLHGAGAELGARAATVSAAAFGLGVNQAHGHVS